MPSGEGGFGWAASAGPAPRTRSAAGQEDGRTTILVGPLFGWLGLAAAMAVLPGAMAPVVFVVLSIYVFLGPSQVIKGLTILTFLVMASPIVSIPGREGFRWVVLLAAFLRAAADTVGPPTGQQKVPRAVMILTAFTLIVATVSMFVSPLPTISVFKILSFWIGASSLLVAFHRARPPASYWRSWLLTFLAFYIIESLIFYGLGLGYERTTRLFQGAFSHPQILGSVSGVMLALVMGTYFEGQLRAGLALPLAAGAAAMVYLSGARTGAVAVGGGLLLAILLGLFSRTGRARGMAFLANPVNTFLIVLMLAGSAYYAQSVSALLSEFVLKGDEPAELTTLFEESRGDLMGTSMANFYEHPWLGIGFGMPSDLIGFDRMITYVGGIPVSARVEKGFMPTAVLEEVGLIGAFVVLSLIVSLAWMPVRHGGFATRWVFGSALLLNVGAAILFSMGGLGLLMWTMLTFSHGQAKWAFQNRTRATG